MRVPIENPRPDIEAFRALVLRQKAPKRMHFVELFADVPIMKCVVEEHLGAAWVDPQTGDRRAGEAYLDNLIRFWHRLGYDYVWAGVAGRAADTTYPKMFTGKLRVVEDRAALSKGERTWMEQKAGVITSWEDFQTYPWPAVENVPLWPYEYLSQHVPEGMGIMMSFCQGFLENVMNVLVGFESLAYLLYEQPDLIQAVFDKVGAIILGLYARVADLPNVAGFFQGDDMGWKGGTLISPEHLRKYVLPWHKKLAALAHEHDLLYLLHSCGNIEAITEDLIEDVKIDAKHSFEDAVIPVTAFKAQYGARVGVLGGIDIDKLAQFEPDALRAHVRGVLDACMPGGGYALGTGNSVTNYIPVKNYLTMLDEGVRWMS